MIKSGLPPTEEEGILECLKSIAQHWGTGGGRTVGRPALERKEQGGADVISQLKSQERTKLHTGGHADILLQSRQVSLAEDNEDVIN